MKKIYSIVLMATMLLVGTNVWATPLAGNTGADLQNAIYAIMQSDATSGSIELTQPVDLSRTVWVGTRDLEGAQGAYKSITIDLNGHNITMNGVRNAKNELQIYVMFALTHGELKIINSSATEAKVQLSGETANNSRNFVVYGSPYSSRWADASTLSANPINTRDQGWCSHLEIGTNVLLYAPEGCYAEGIAVDRLEEGKSYYKNGNTTESLSYGGQLFKHKNNKGVYVSGYGFAQGVRVDLKGKIDIVGGASGKVYGISVKGNVESPISVDREINDLNGGKYGTYAAQYYNNNEEPYNAQGQLIQNVTHKLDTLDAPFIWVHPGAEVKVRANGDKVTSLYAAGYAKWLVQGYAEGKTGMYVSSGAVDLEDAYVKSTAETYTGTSSMGSANGGGSGVVLNSRDAYAGDIEFTVSGDSKIESVAGFAIEEAVNTTKTLNPDYGQPGHEDEPQYNQETNVSHISIEGGTIEGGAQGSIGISVTTITAATSTTEETKTTTIEVLGGNVAGATQLGDGTIELDDILPSDVHKTEVTVDDGKGGTKTVVVISEGEAPTAAETKTTWNDIATNAATAIAQNDTVNAVWSAAGTGEIATGKVVLGELQMLAGTAGDGNGQILTVKSGAILDVQHLMMNSYAQIIVEAGGLLIIEGDQGIVAPANDNIILKASNTEQATFLINPKVQSNRHPNATVKMVAKGIGYLDVVNVGKSYFWHRFALPIKEATSWTKTPNVSTFVFGWNYNNDAWEQYSALTQMKPFQGLTMTAETTPLTDVEYTFKGQLAGGNDNQDLLFKRNGYNFFGNSYTGHISVLALVNQLVADPMIDATVWAWRPTTQTYHPVPLLALSANPGKYEAWQKEVAPMNTFILKQNGAGTNTTVLNYADAVWNNPRYNGVKGNAPRRRVEAVDESTYMTIIVSAENGKTDFVMFTEDGQFSDEYENGYDGAKYMNENALNMYASVNGADYSVVATDNLEGKTLTINTVNDINYTMTFENVNGAEYAVRDNATGAVFAIEEGASYEFAAQPNAVAEGRFEIIPVAKVPTAIDNTEAKADAKGIYTIMGQYVGEDFEVLPAGIYVVNGVKIVK